MIDYRVLGSVGVVRDGEVIDLGARTQRAVLALLVLHANEPVQAGTMVDALWTEPPTSASKIIQNCVMRLRRVLPEGSLVTRDHAYELRVGQGDIDADRFARAVDAGREALRHEEFSSALVEFDGALAEWRGAPLRDLGDPPFVDEAIRRLESLRLGAMRDRVDAALALGRHTEVLSELEGLVRAHPLDERLRAQLMLALYRSGQQAAALEVYREGRRTLVDELGVEPGPAISRLEQSILRQDPALDGPALDEVPVRAAGRARPRLAVVGGLVAVAAALVAVVVVHATRGSTAAVTPPNSVAVVDPKAGRVVSRIRVGSFPTTIAVVHHYVWVGNTADRTMTEIDPRSGNVLVPGLAVASNNISSVTSITPLDGALWAVDSGAGDAIRVAALVCCSIEHYQLPVRERDGSDFLTVTADEQHVWFTSSLHSALLEMDAGLGRVVARIALPGTPIAAASGLGSVWCITSRGRGGLLVRVDETTGRIVARIPLLATPTAVTTGYGLVWVTLPSRDEIVRIDPATNTVVRTIHVPGRPVAVAAGLGAVWVAAGATERLIRVYPASGAVAPGIQLAGIPHALAIAAGKIWVVGA
jgi:DNA-binding SARP family transcriptional activator/streptogramin lyase